MALKDRLHLELGLDFETLIAGKQAVLERASERSSRLICSVGSQKVDF